MRVIIKAHMTHINQMHILMTQVSGGSLRSGL